MLRKKRSLLPVEGVNKNSKLAKVDHSSIGEALLKYEIRPGSAANV